MDIVQIRNEIPTHLSEYFARDPNYIVWKLQSGWKENHDAWLAHECVTEHARADFYRHNDTYIWELANWNMEQGRWWGVTLKLAEFIKDQGIKTVVDLGGGIGTDALVIASILPDVEILLVEPNMVCREFFLWRRNKYGLGERLFICEPEEYQFKRPVDLTICLDVLEHVERPMDLLENILRTSRLIAMNFAGNFKPADFPMHLPKNQ
ncbi:hypothetical protein LCGC14_3161840, partial [marine sediment metagenome]